ncbi:MAG: hypothetical protein RJA90_1016 [Bacteroidota bacterium]
MKIWQNFKNFHFNKSLNKGLVSRSKQVSSKSLSFATASIEKYAESLRKKGKTTFLLGLNAASKDIVDTPFPCLNKKNIDWAGRPIGTLIDEWFIQPVDVVIHVSAQRNELLEYITALTPAGLRIGPATDNTRCYDLMLDVPADTTPQSFFKQMENLLGKIQVRNESTLI